MEGAQCPQVKAELSSKPKHWDLARGGQLQGQGAEAPNKFE